MKLSTRESFGMYDINFWVMNIIFEAIFGLEYKSNLRMGYAFRILKYSRLNTYE